MQHLPDAIFIKVELLDVEMHYSRSYDLHSPHYPYPSVAATVQDDGGSRSTSTGPQSTLRAQTERVFSLAAAHSFPMSVSGNTSHDCKHSPRASRVQ